MNFRSQIKSVPDVRTKIGRVLRSSNGLVDVMSIGGSSPINNIKVSGVVPAIGDWVTISFYKNNEITATPISTKENSSDSSGNTTIISSTFVNSPSAFVPGNGLETDLYDVTHVRLETNRFAFSGGKIDFNPAFFTAPSFGQVGHFLIANATGTLGFTKRMYMPDPDTLVINNHSEQPVFTLDVLDGAEISLPLTLGAAGGIWQGTGTFASPTTGLKIWNDTGIGRIAGYNSSVLQWNVDTDGKLYAGAGSVKLDSDGITLSKNNGVTPAASIKWLDTNTNIVGYNFLGWNRLDLTNAKTSVDGVALTTIEALGGSGTGFGGVVLRSFAGGTEKKITIQTNADGIDFVGNLMFTPTNTYDIGTGSNPRNITVDGYAWAKKTLNAGTGANRNAIYSLDVKEADLALATPTGSWVFNYTIGSVPNDGYDQKVRIWAYKTVGGRKIFSSGYLELSGTDNAMGGVNYSMDVTLNAVTGADGYWIRLIDESYNYGSGLTGYWWDVATTGTFVYDVGNLEWDGSGFNYTSPEIPVTPTVASTDLIVGNRELKIKMPIVLSGLTSGQISLWATDVAGSNIIYLPAASGTVALVENVPSGTGTSGKLTKWTGSASVGDSIVTESGATISVAGAATVVGGSNTNQLIVKSHSTQTAAQILIQSSASAELARIFASSTNIFFGNTAGNGVSSGVEMVGIGKDALKVQSTAGYSIAIGGGALASANANNNVAIGSMAANLTTSGVHIVAIGANALRNNLTGGYSVAIGDSALILATGLNNIAIGDGAMYNTIGGGYNTAIGANSLKQNVSGVNNVAIGDSALLNVTSSYNVGIGPNALKTQSSGGWSIAIGSNALAFANANNNIAIGDSAMYVTTSGAYNVAIGANSLKTNSSGASNIAIGSNALAYADASYNVAIGDSALYVTTSGAYNLAIGANTLKANSSGAYNTAIGSSSLYTNVSGAQNTAIGFNALYSCTSSNNTAIGFQAAYSLGANGSGVFIGYQAGYNETGANKLYIHNSNSTTPLIYGLFAGTGAGLRVTSQATDGTPLVVRGIASQASTLQDWQDSAAAVLAYVSATGKFVAATPTTTTASITLPAGTAPTSPVSGDVWQDSTRKATYGFFAGINQGLVGCIFTGTADATVGNTLTETSIMPTGIGALTLPANFWTIGKSVRIKLWGKMSKGITSVTRKYTLLLGATTLKTNTTAAGTSALTDDGWQFDALITCRTTGVTGTVYTQIKQYHYGVSDPILVGTATVTIDTTASALLDYKFQWSANDASNSFVTTNATVEVLN